MLGLLARSGGTVAQLLADFLESNESTPPSGLLQHSTGAVHCFRLSAVKHH